MTDLKNQKLNQKKIADQTLVKQLLVWRKKAINQVQQIACKQEQQRLARRYYKADQDAVNTGLFNHSWEEMEKYLGKPSEQELKQERDKLIKAKVICNNVTYYKKAWLPTLQEYRQQCPFIQEEQKQNES